MIIVTTEYGDKMGYSTVEDFIRELIDDSSIENIITNDFGYIEMPLIGKVEYGKAIHRCATSYDWTNIKENYIFNYVEEIEDAICDGTSYMFEGFIIKDTESC